MLNPEYRVEIIVTSAKAESLKAWFDFSLDDLLTWHSFSSLKAIEFLPALAAILAELPQSWERWLPWAGGHLTAGLKLDGP